MWLDEALSVDIARLPLGRIAAALRHDGHPPLYYALLHGWMVVFGSGDRAVRALSGVLSLLTLPLGYRAGRRLGGTRVGWMTVLVLSLSPYFLRYGSEARMYALLIALVFAGYLLVLNALEGNGMGYLVGIVPVTSALVWSHYWSLWLVIAVGGLLAVRLGLRWRSDHELDRRALAVVVAIGVGAVTLAPWLPTMLYQSAHTGTPWAKPFRPTTLLVQSVQDFSGGPYSEAQVLSLITVVLVVIGVFGRGIDAWKVELDLHTRVEARLPAALLVSTAVVASVAGIATHTTFNSRYAAVFFPFFVLLVALGLDHFQGATTRSVVLSVFLVLSLVGCFFVLRRDRTQAGVVADAIVAAEHRAPPSSTPPLIVICPDQLGPSVARVVRQRLGDATDIVTYPRFAAPEFVDWVDYAERNRHNDPKEFANELLGRSAGRTLYFVYSDTYQTLQSQCFEVLATLGGTRPPTHLVTADADSYYEPMSLEVLPPVAPPNP